MLACGNSKLYLAGIRSRLVWNALFIDCDGPSWKIVKMSEDDGVRCSDNLRRPGHRLRYQARDFCVAFQYADSLGFVRWSMDYRLRFVFFPCCNRYAAACDLFRRPIQRTETVIALRSN